MAQPATPPAAPTAKPHYTSERAWIEHLRLMAELPYPSWLLIPTIAEVLRAHLNWDVIILAWDDRTTLQPTDFWIAPVQGALLQRYMARLNQYVSEVPIEPLLQTRGRIFRIAEVQDSFEASALYREFFEPYGVRWGVTVPFELGENSLAFLGLLRSRAGGRYSDADQDRLDRVARALNALDRAHHPWADLPEAALRETATATAVLDPSGAILLETGTLRDVLFAASHSALELPTWPLPDQSALPAQVQALLAEMWNQPHGAQRRELRLRKPWGAFDFELEHCRWNGTVPGPVITVTARHHQPLDIAVARRLWGWPLSPREKRILVASARQPGRAELAKALGLTQGTLRHYINQLQGRMGVSSRQALLDRVLQAQPDP